MKTSIIAIALLIASASASFAQVSFGGGAHSGITFTSFPQAANQMYGIGFGGGVHGDLNILPALGFRFGFDYNTFPSDKTRLKGLFRVTDPNGNPTNDFTVEGANISNFGIMANVLGKIPTGSSVRPYGIVGFGLQILNMSDVNVISNGQTLLTQSGGNSSTNFGLNFGAGVEFGLGRRTNLFIDAKYSLIFTSGGSSSLIPVTLGVSF
jgi:opacity protein-like surface antigen